MLCGQPVSSPVCSFFWKSLLFLNEEPALSPFKSFIVLYGEEDFNDAFDKQPNMFFNWSISSCFCISSLQNMSLEIFPNSTMWAKWRETQSQPPAVWTLYYWNSAHFVIYLAEVFFCVISKVLYVCFAILCANKLCLKNLIFSIGQCHIRGIGAYSLYRDSEFSLIGTHFTWDECQKESKFIFNHTTFK